MGPEIMEVRSITRYPCNGPGIMFFHGPTIGAALALRLAHARSGLKPSVGLVVLALDHAQLSEL